MNRDTGRAHVIHPRLPSLIEKAVAITFNRYTSLSSPFLVFLGFCFWSFYGLCVFEFLIFFLIVVFRRRAVGCGLKGE